MSGTYAILDQGGKVKTIILAPSQFVQQYYPGAIEIDSITPAPGIGWSYFKGEFTPPAA